MNGSIIFVLVLLVGTMRIAVDTGGTFTDFVYQDIGSVRVLKIPSTPLKPYCAVVEGVRKICSPKRLLVGTTLVTNCLLQRNAPPIALLTTEGFEDVVEIGRQNRDELYSLYPERPRPLVERNLRFGVRERVGADGSILIPLNEEDVRRTALKLKRYGIRRAAVVFLFSFLNPQNERKAAEILGEYGIDAVCSSYVLPEFREYERTSTTVISAYTEPVFREFRDMVGRVCEEVFFMLSSGGFAPADVLKNRSVYTALSGPVAGCSGALIWAKKHGFGSTITLDMGGTSTDVCALLNELPLKKGVRIGGLYAHIVSVSVETVGAGGGSIIWVDSGGALRVGPESSGADPGPAAYGRGGPPTLTDALLLLGRLPMRLPSGLQLLREASEKALKPLAAHLGLDTLGLASSAVKVAVASTTGAIRTITVRRGYDTRLFSLFAFGGVGPLLAAEIAEELSIDRIVVPPEPGGFSAFGLLCSGAVFEEAISVHKPLRLMGEDELRTLKAQLKERIRSQVREKSLRYTYSAELRYPQQSYELRIPASGSIKAVIRRFHRTHRRLYGYAFADEDVELTVLRIRAETPPVIPDGRFEEVGFEPDERESRVVWRGEETGVRLLRRSELRQERSPLIICDYSSTVFVPPGWGVRRDGVDNLLMERR